MYRIIKTDGTELGLTDEVRYIKIGRNGCFVSATKETASGVAYQSVPYNLFGHTEIEGADMVIVSEVDAGSEINDLVNTIKVLLGLTDV